MVEELRIIEESCDALEEYGRIPISFRAFTRMSLKGLMDLPADEWTEIAIGRFMKDYDDCIDDRPTSLPKRFDVSNWRIIAAFDGDRRVGGAILARETPGLEMLEGRSDLALMMDIRIHPEFRGQGVGAQVFYRIEDWVKQQGCTEMKVETQDINVAACRFYYAQGMRLSEINVNAYEGLDETQLIWRMSI